MRSQRTDLMLIIFCAVPVVGFLVVYLGYQTTGSMPFGLPVVTLPALPSSSAIDSMIPSEWSTTVDAYVNSLRQNLWLAIGGGTIAVLTFISLTGIWVDKVHVLAPAVSEAEDADDAAIDDNAPAPWLTEETGN